MNDIFRKSLYIAKGEHVERNRLAAYFAVNFSLCVAKPLLYLRYLRYLRYFRDNRKATLISAYAPTLVAHQQDKEVFYGDLDNILSQVPRRNKIILLGDFNARVGKDHRIWNKIIGKDGTGKPNSNGEMLLTKCAEHNLTITNTLFRQQDRLKTSWRHPRSGHWHLIDFIIARQSDARDIHLTRAMESSDACWTDHRLVMSLLSIQIQPKQRKTKKKKPTKFNTGRLSQPETVRKFQKEIAENIKDIQPDNDDNTWNRLKEAITKTCNAELGKQERRHEDWFDENDAEISALMGEEARSLQKMAERLQKPTETEPLPPSTIQRPENCENTQK